MRKVVRPEKIYIPKVSKKRIRELAKRIKPVAQSRIFGLVYISAGNLFDENFLDCQKYIGKAVDLTPLCDIATYHRRPAVYHFRADVSEVLAQIPARYLNSTVAFEIVSYPVYPSEFESKEQKAPIKAGYFKATTRLYARK